ncbi:MAG: glycosyltransferase, partial [Candidatus Peribacteraceae bacterium]|nr:glycosyltransferase [Candidatus Peribacteraceae bacterium]
YEKCDVLHLNVTPNSIGNIHRIRRHLSECDNPPLLVANIDHAIEMWSGFKRFDIFMEELTMVDRLFGVEPATVNTLATLLDKKVWHINHPTDVKLLQKEYANNRVDDPFPYKTVLLIAHPYDRNYLVATWTLLKLKEEHPDLKLLMVGQIENEHAFLRKEYDEFYKSMPFPALMELISRADCVIDTAVTHSGGRVPVECAAVGTPCVGNSAVDTMTKYHSDFVVDIQNGRMIYNTVEAAVYGGVVPATPDGYDESRKLFEEMING